MLAPRRPGRCSVASRDLAAVDARYGGDGAGEIRCGEARAEREPRAVTARERVEEGDRTHPDGFPDHCGEVGRDRADGQVEVDRRIARPDDHDRGSTGGSQRRPGDDQVEDLPA